MSAKLLHSCPTFCDPGLESTRLCCPWDSLGKNTGMGCHFLLQWIFPTQGSNPYLLHWTGALPSEPPVQIKATVRYHLQLVRMAIIKKSTNNKCWRGCGENGTFLHCWCGCKLIEPLWDGRWYGDSLKH